LPLRLEGTPFQRRVWERLQRIPRGQTLTYGELARELGTGARAIGGACRANRILLLVPCHRVVGRRGAGGFAGHRNGRWPRIKRWLLANEGTEIA
jgi:methylated-DNA-[protein]-cysteine S-methyltransferase